MIAINCWSVMSSSRASLRSMACTGRPSSRSKTSLMACRSPPSARSSNFSMIPRRRRRPPLSTFRFTPISGHSRGTSARLKRANFGSPGRLTLDVFEVADAYHATSSNIRIHNNVVVVRKLRPEKNDFYANGAHGDGERLCFMRGS